jgi:hypothetical protein
LVKDAVQRLYESPDVFLAQVDADVRRVKETLAEETTRVGLLQERLAHLSMQELKVLEWARKGYIEESQMLQQLDQIRAERGELQGQIEAATPIAEQASDLMWAADCFRELAATARMVPGFTDERTGEKVEPTEQEWKELIRAVVDRIWIEPDGSVTFEGPLVSRTSELTPSR